MLRASADTGMGSTGGSAVYVHLGDVLVAQDAWAWRSPFGMTFFHVDHQGTPIARSDAWGMVFERTRRQSFGQPLVGPLKNGPGYTGHMEDPGAGLVYMQQRYYDPAIARFLSVDPVGPLADPTNHFGRYHYGLNNPYRFTDPDGRCALGTRIETASCDGFNGLSVGQMIDRQGEAAAMRGDHGMTAVAALGKGLWTMAGAEELSKWAAGQASSGVGVGLEVLAAVPFVGAIGKGVVAARGAFDIAKAGGKHAEFLKNYAGRSPAEIQKGIASIENQIAEHQSWIANPQSKIPNFGSLDPRQQAALINSKWPADIARQQEQLDILRGLLSGQ